MSSFPFNLALFFDRLCRGTPACLYGFGLSVAARKALLLPEWAGAGALAAGWAALWALWALGLAAGIALRKPFSREYADAWLDWKNRAGGAVLAHADPAPPRVRPGITLRPFAKSVAPPLAFALAALALPAMRGREHRAAEAIRNRVDAAEELLAARGEMLAPPDRERFARQLEAMRDVAEENPEAAAEALASFERRVAEAEAEERRSGPKESGLR